jgi:FkbM family methyltransferase
MAKTVKLYGRTFSVSGGEKDDYYRHIPDGVDITDPLLRGLRSHVADDAVCIDAGANIGLYSLALSSLAPKGTVYAFEPSPSAYSHLADNLRVNRAANVEASQLALSDREGTVTFHDFSFFSAGSFSSDEGSLLTSDSYGSTSFDAPTTTLDTFVAERGIERVDFVKIDVEGAELSVLEGATETLAKHRPVVVLEFNSFGFTIHQSVLPQVALARIRALFPHVYVVDRVDGELAALETPHEEYEFLYDNGIHGPADNMLCSFEPLAVDRRYSHIWTIQRGGEVPVQPVDEAAAMRRTLSWRVTAPLRQARARLEAAGADKVLRRFRRTG